MNSKRPCPKCGKVNWVRRTQRTYQCVNFIPCPDCAVRTKAERVALILGSLSCETCSGNGAVCCNHRITGADNLPPLRHNRPTPPKPRSAAPKSF